MQFNQIKIDQSLKQRHQEIKGRLLLAIHRFVIQGFDAQTTPTEILPGGFTTRNPPAEVEGLEIRTYMRERVELCSKQVEADSSTPHGAWHRLRISAANSLDPITQTSPITHQVSSKMIGLKYKWNTSCIEQIQITAELNCITKPLLRPNQPMEVGPYRGAFR